MSGFICPANLGKSIENTNNSLTSSPLSEKGCLFLKKNRMYFSDQPILSDFRTFLDYIEQKGGLELTKDKNVLRSADLLTLNELFYNKALHVNNKSKQVAFTTINTFFYIARISELTIIQQIKQKFYLVTKKDRVLQFDALSDDEQYFFLLESFWCYENWDEAYDCRSFWDEAFYLKLAEKPAEQIISIGERDLKRPGEIKAPIYLFAAEIFAAFGFLRLVWDEQLEKKMGKYIFPYKSAAVTALGKIILPLLFEKRKLYIWHDLDPHYNPVIQARMEEHLQGLSVELEAYESILGISDSSTFFPENRMNPTSDDDTSEEVNPYEEPFAAAFLNAFPDLKIEKRLYPIERPYREGQYVFKVALGHDIYRTIALDATMTLEDLHLAIQKIYKFDDDHLYAFYMDGNPWSNGESYTDDRGFGGEGILAAVVQIGELGLYEGKTFLYLFDFGDNWHFYCTVLSIDANAKPLKKYKLLESVGKAPEQYGSEDDWEEEDWEEEA